MASRRDAARAACHSGCARGSPPCGPPNEGTFPRAHRETAHPFVDSRVTPSFPSGLTIQDGRGQWRDSNGTIEKERSYELILLYPAGEAMRRGPLIEKIREAYIKAYVQDSVARLDEPTLADF